MDYLDHHLLRLDGSKDILSHSLYLYPVAEFLCDLVADIGVKQSPADVLQGFSDVDLRYPSFASQYLERPLKPFL